MDSKPSITLDPEKLYETFYEKYIKLWKYSQLNDESRPENSSKTGGLDLLSKETTTLIRSTGWELIKQIGKKLISGDFNLTTVSIPIKVMQSATILQSLSKSLINYPFYFHLASMAEDPVEKMKYVIVAYLSSYHFISMFLKPMNPILGETYENVWEDGSRLYCEQTSHHPPISNYLMLGPKNEFKYHGYSNFSSSAGFNSLKVFNKGRRYVEFRDKTKIEFDFCSETYSNSFWGTLRHESLGDIKFTDLTNGYECVIKISSVKKKPSDYITGEIKLKNQVVSKVYGSYLSHIEFDNIRYWDRRENVYLKSFEVAKPLDSCSLVRQDRVLWEQNKLNEAQIAKESLEGAQRTDRKLREKWGKLKK